MNLREYYSQMTAFYINRDVDTDRRQAIEHRLGPLFANVIRIPAVEGSDFSEDQVRRFYARAKGRDEETWPIQEKSKKPWANALGILYSHIAALQAGIDHGADRFMVFEDDAFPRMAVVNLAQPTPAYADLALHGWFLDRSSAKMNETFANRERKPDARDSIFWKTFEPVDDPMNRIVSGAHAYEVNHRGAVDLLGAMAIEDQPADRAYYRTMSRVPSAYLSLPSFHQDWSFGSVRTGAGPKLDRYGIFNNGEHIGDVYAESAVTAIEQADWIMAGRNGDFWAQAELPFGNALHSGPKGVN